MNQDERKKILFGIDKNENYSNEELYLADLTPYYKFKNESTSFFEKIIEYKTDKYKMVHNPKISFAPAQRKIFEQINQCDKCKYAISATTSFGKTTLIKEYIKRFQPQIVIYVVPTNSLADELLTDFEKLYKCDGYEIFDTSIQEIGNSKMIFIGTQEKLKEIPWLLTKKINLFVIDEAYKLADEVNGFREIILNRIFIDYMSKTDKYLLLLPLVNSIIGLESWGFRILKTDYSPVEKDYIGINDDIYDSFIVGKIKNNDEKNKSLVYFSSPPSLENFIKKYLLDSNIIIEDEWIKRVESDFHSDWFPVLAYKMGLAIHYGPMPKFFQIKMVNNFNKNKKFNTIFSTSSLIEGVNTPTKNIFIKDEGIFNADSRIKYKNLIGRAGRLGITPIGNIYYNNNNKSQFEEANQNWDRIDIQIIIDKDDILEQINRNDKNKSLKLFSEEYELPEDDINLLIEEKNVSIDELKILIINLKKYNNNYTNDSNSRPPSSVPDLIYFYNTCYYKNKKSINNYIIKTKSKLDLVLLLNISEKSREVQDKEINKIKYKFLGALLSATMNQKLNNKSMNSISSMFQYIIGKTNLSLFESSNSEIISSIIGMIYSYLPYELIPFLELVVSINNIFKENKKYLLEDNISNYLELMIRKYSLRYFGKIDCTEKERKVIKRMFEYGIPYNEVKEYIQFFVDNTPDSFSINHIKSLIETNDELKLKLGKYFY